MHRVDAARQMMSNPRKGAEASGRLFLAKRCHEAAKAGKDVLGQLDALVAEVKDSLSEGSHEGIDLEAEHIRRHLQSA